jgi:hypothetical protein
MIIAKKLERIGTDEARNLDWKKLTHDFSKDFIEAFIDMQPNCSERMAVANYILEALHGSRDYLLFGDETAEHIEQIISHIENGVYSPYSEIQRLIAEGKYKDSQIDAKMDELERIRQTGSEAEERHLLKRIIDEAKTLGPLGALYTEVMLRRIYPDNEGIFDELKACIRDDCRMQYTFNAPVGVVC